MESHLDAGIKKINTSLVCFSRERKRKQSPFLTKFATWLSEITKNYELVMMNEQDQIIHIQFSMNSHLSTETPLRVLFTLLFCHKKIYTEQDFYSALG